MNNYVWCLEYCNMLFGASFTPVARLCERLAALGLLTPYDPDFEHTMEIGRGLMRRYRNAMRELARR